MEVLNPTTPKSSQIFSKISTFCPKITDTTWRNKKRLKFTPCSNIPFSLNSPFSNPKRFQISARFGRPTNRRNSLRKKLTEQQQVSHSPIINDPCSDFESPVNNDDISTFQSKLDSDRIETEDIVESDSLKKSKSKLYGDSGLSNKLESWIDQYKADLEFWGVGSGPIFTVVQNSDGKVERVDVNEDEILRRGGLEPALYKKSDMEDFKEVRSKILHAKYLTTETENGNNLISNNSSVAKFVVSSGESKFVNAIQGVTLPPKIFSRVSRIGIGVLCGIFVFWGVKRLFSTGEGKTEYTSLDKEMLRRKQKARMEKENSMKGSVEVIKAPKEPELKSTERPRLDKQDLMDNILKAKRANDNLAVEKSSDINFEEKIQEITAMVRHAREADRNYREANDGVDNEVSNELHNAKELIQQGGERATSSPNDLSNGYLKRVKGVGETINLTFFDDPEVNATDFVDISMEENNKAKKSNSSEVDLSNDSESRTSDVKDKDDGLNLSGPSEVSQLSDAPPTQLFKPKESYVKAKPRVIRSVKEAREYLSQKRDPQEQNEELLIRTGQENATIVSISNKKENDRETSQGLDRNDQLGDISSTNASIASTLDEKGNISTKNDEDIEERVNHQKPVSSLDLGISDKTGEAAPSVPKENWMEKNFHEFEPVVKRIAVGFKDNYMVAKERANQELNLDSEMKLPKPNEDDGELDWIRDDRLREIVFQVRENELMGREPFDLMDAEDKRAFFGGLEKKVVKENEKLQNLHQWVHSNIENLNYGADGISVNDPPEKIFPRWKGPPVDTNTSPEFLTDYLEQRKALGENLRSAFLENRNEEISLQTSAESSPNKDVVCTPAVHTQNEKQDHQAENVKSPKIVIEGSDGSVRAGKKHGKEFWAHTKKWSRGFIDSYNAEQDPEIKATMKDIGKDLDRWITEKEIKESADLMDKLPKRGRQFIQEKLNKVKREMELYGPQAVVSKYSELAEEEVEDYLWWLDLPFVLCIELYTNEDGAQTIGLYSLEMAEDLELDPKQYHMIAFEDAGDCKNVCYIIQGHMEMLGNGNASVVAQAPKDAFREAKANGFGVTVIRKGELKLNVDQTLEEVEEQIMEIGSKVYHDKIMKGRKVDISSLMRGVFGTGKSIKRKRSKRMLKKPTITE